MSTTIFRRSGTDRSPLVMATEVHSAMFRITRLTVTALASYLLALWVLPKGIPPPVLASLTALLVVEYSLYETIKSGFRRVAAVTLGVLVAVIFASQIGFGIWTLGLAIGAALIIGTILRLGDHILEVPISTMLIFALGTATAWGATERVLETLIGAGTGLAVMLLMPSVRVRPAANAMQGLGEELARIIDGIVNGLRDEPREGETRRWLNRLRAFGRDINHADHALGRAENSVRFNPRARQFIDAGVALRDGLETLEHATLTYRGLVRALDDSAHRDTGVQILSIPQVRARLAAVLAEVAASTKAYGRLARSDLKKSSDPIEVERELQRHTAAAAEERERLARVLSPEGVPSAQWPLYGEVLTHLDRIIGALRAERRAHARQHWRRHRANRHLPEPQARVVREAGDRLRRLATSATPGVTPNDRRPLRSR